LGLDVFFTIKDERGFPVAKDAVTFEEGSVLQILGGDSSAVPVEPQDPTTPIKVALVLDASGSMRPFIAQVREAAKQAVDTAPENTLFAVYRFTAVSIDQSFEPIQSFTGDRNLVKLAIDAIEADPGGVTCLYNATFKALDALDAATNPNAPERRAMLLFTDGRDDNGQGGTCSNWDNADAVKAKAKASAFGTIPIHTIGLCTQGSCDNINRAELDQMAEDTFGYSAIGSIESVEESFQKIMDGLRSQWVVQASVYPCNQDQGVLVLQTNLLAQSLTGSFTFTADRCYSPPLVPALATITGPTESEQDYTFEISITSLKPDTIAAADVLVSFPDNTLAYSVTLPYDPAQALSVVVPKDKLTAGGEYEIEVRAKTADGTAIPAQDGRVELATKAFIHDIGPEPDLPSAAISIEPVVKGGDGSSLFLPVNVNITDRAGLLDQNAQFINSTVRIFFNGSEIKTHEVRGFDLANPQIQVPLEPNQLQAGQTYDISVEITAPALEPIVSPGLQFNPVLPAPPSFWQAFILPVIGNPFIVGGILLVIGLAAFVIVYTSQPKKQTIPEPVQPPITVIDRKRGDYISDPRNATVIATTSEQPAPRLKVLVVQTADSALRGKEWVVSFPCVIGRENGEVLIPGDKKISRRHAEIALQDGKIIIKDLDSANGIALVATDPQGEQGSFTVKTRLERGGAVEWDGFVLLRLGPNTVLKLETLEQRESNPNATQIQDNSGYETRILD
jgi:hypothetical protein